MTAFHYRAVATDGRLHCGILQADTVSELERELARSGLCLLRCARGGWHPGALTQRRPAYDARLLAMMSFHLSHLLAAGVSLPDALEELIGLESRPAWRRLLTEVRDRVVRGAALADALTHYQASVGRHCLACIRAGEASGELPACLDRLERSLRWQYALSQRLTNLLAYPSLAAVTLAGVMAWLFGHLVPQLLDFLAASGLPPGVPTRSLAAVSAAVVQSGPTALAALLTLAVTTVVLVRTSVRCRLGLHALLLRCGPPGRVLQQLLLARYADTAGLLLASGVGLLDSLAISEAQVSNLSLRAHLARLRERVLAGESLAEAMVGHPVLPATLMRFVAAGESAGVLPQALSKAAEQLQFSARHALERVEAVLPSLVLALVGLLLFWVVAAVIVPVYDLIAFSGRLL